MHYKTIKFNIKIPLNIHKFHFCRALLREKLDIATFWHFSNFPPPPPIRKMDRCRCLPPPWRSMPGTPLSTGCIMQDANVITIATVVNNMHRNKVSRRISIQWNLVITMSLGPWKLSLLYSGFSYQGKKKNIKRWDQQNYFVIRGFCYIRPLYNEVPLYIQWFMLCKSEAKVYILLAILKQQYFTVLHTNDDKQTGCSSEIYFELIETQMM